MNDEILEPEALIEEVETQALTEYSECIDTIIVSHKEYIANPKDKELKELYLESKNDLKTLLGEYTSMENDTSLIQEAFDIIFEEIEDEF